MFWDNDICWCADSDKCKIKECFRHLSNKPVVKGTDIFTMSHLFGSEMCPFFELVSEQEFIEEVW